VSRHSGELTLDQRGLIDPQQPESSTDQALKFFAIRVNFHFPPSSFSGEVLFLGEPGDDLTTLVDGGFYAPLFSDRAWCHVSAADDSRFW
jgi:hypothetical protein